MNPARNTMASHESPSSDHINEFLAPARVNLIGEHTDYTGGLVLPMAISFYTAATVSAGVDGKYSFVSEMFETERTISRTDCSNATRDWSDYPVGVLRQLQIVGIEPPPFTLRFRGNIPLGSGLSSSASIEVATAIALLALSGKTFPADEIAVLCQCAENEYVGSPCGIMDQFVITAAEAEHALLLNTRDLTYELVPLNRGGLADCCIVVANSMVKHSIASGDYGLRRREVEVGQDVLRRTFPELLDLADATLEQLAACKKVMSDESYRRCRHIITENGRVLEAKLAMLDGDPARLGDAMARSHASERDDFECSVEEIDFLVDTAVSQNGCYGARLTGGGFGGCTINLVQTSEAESFSEQLKARYQERFGIDGETYICDAVDGAMARLAKTASTKNSGMPEIFAEAPHRRWNPLRREWVLVSPHRTQRPWQGQTEEKSHPTPLEYDPTCYLCPGNTRAGGHLTPKYGETYVFDNDYAALELDVLAAAVDVDHAGLLKASIERGVCRVICFDPRHDLTLATMKIPSIRRVVEVWAEQESEFASRDDIGYVQIFENRGAMMGASNPHPHGQIWATEHVPNEPTLELAAQSEHFARRQTALLRDYLNLELKQKERIVAENERWVALVPFWAVWPFELLLLPRAAVANVRDLKNGDRQGLAAMLKTVTSGYNRVFDTPFPYSMGLHPAPCDGAAHPEWHLHAHFYPPLLRSATIRKFMVGFELLGSPQRDLTPESAAAILRSVMDTNEIEETL